MRAQGNSSDINLIKSKSDCIDLKKHVEETPAWLVRSLVMELCVESYQLAWRVH